MKDEGGRKTTPLNGRVHRVHPVHHVHPVHPVRSARCIIALLLLIPAGCSRRDPPRNAPTTEGIYNRSTHHLVQDERIRSVLAQSEYHREDLLKIALLLNHEILSARSGTLAARARRRQASLWQNPTLNIMQEGMDAGPLSASESETIVEFAQPLPLSPRRRRAIAAGRAEEAELAAREAATRRRILAEVDRYHTDILAYMEAERLQMELMDVAEDLLQRTRAAHDSGHATDGDLARMRYERSFAEYEVTRLVAERIYLTQELTVFLGLPEINPARISGTLVPALIPEDIAFERESIISGHPELAAADLAVSRREAERHLARASAIPDPTVTAGAGYDHGDDEFSLRAGLGIPLPIFDRNQGRADEARVLLTQAQHDRDQAALALRSDLVDTFQRISEYDTLAQVWRADLVPAAAESLREIAQRHDRGETSGLELADAFRTWSAARKREVEYVRQLNLALTRLRALRGYPEFPAAE